jgi:1-acyl-sn-glycerol-3-phosphate acyltransferase
MLFSSLNPLNVAHEIHADLTVGITAVTSKVSPWLRFLVYPLGRYGLMPFYFQRITVIGQEHIPAAGPVILAPTHRSRWDPLIIPYVAGRDVTGRDPRFMVSVNETQGLQGWFILHLGGFPIDPERPAIASLRHGIELLQNGEMLVIFPEGGDLNANRESLLNKLHPGLARLALQAETSQSRLGVQVVPISIHYSQPIPHWRCSVEVRIGAPLQVSDYKAKVLKQGAQCLTADLEKALRELQTLSSLPQ